MTKKTKPTRRQADAVRAQREHGTQLVAWMRERQAETKKALRQLFRARKKKAPAGSRGVDRVPAHLDVTGLSQTAWVVEHKNPNRRHRRGAALRTGRSLRSMGPGNTPHVNPMRDLKALRSGRLRKELRP